MTGGIIVGDAFKIKAVYLDDNSSGGKTDISLDIYLSNGQIIIYSLNDRKDDPRFADILSGDYSEEALTDGERISWPNGVSISLDEILNSLHGPDGPARHSRKWRKATILTGVTSAAIIVAILVFSPLSFLQGNQTRLEDPGVPLAATPANEPGFIIQEIDGVTIRSDTRDLEIFLLNPEDCEYYIVFEALLDDKLLAVSEMIAPGGSIDGLKLNEPLVKGVYNAVLKVYTYDAVDFSEKGWVSISFVLNVV